MAKKYVYLVEHRDFDSRNNIYPAQFYGIQTFTSLAKANRYVDQVIEINTDSFEQGNITSDEIDEILLGSNFMRIVDYYWINKRGEDFYEVKQRMIVRKIELQ